MWEGSFGCGFFYFGQFVRRGWVVGGGVLDGTSENRDWQCASRSVFKDFTEDALTFSAGSLLQKWDSPNHEDELATARTASLLVELVGVVA